MLSSYEPVLIKPPPPFSGDEGNLSLIIYRKILLDKLPDDIDISINTAETICVVSLRQCL